MKKILLFSIMTVIAQCALAQLSYNGTAVTIDFDGSLPDVANSAFSGKGFDVNPTPGQLDADAWKVVGFTGSELARGNTLSNFAGIYGTSVSSGMGNSMVIVPDNGFNPGSITIECVNSTGSELTAIELSSTILYKNNGFSRWTLNLGTSSDGVTYQSLATIITPQFPTNDPWVPVTVTGPVIFNSPISTGSSFFIQLEAARTIGGSPDLIAWDNITLQSTAILPVELMYFQAIDRRSFVELQWATATELNNEKWIIERLVDGNMVEVIDSLPGEGSTQVQTDYTYRDRTARHGVNYYRLKQVDYDGQYSYSPVVVINRKAAPHPVLGVVPSPNPTTGEVFIDHNHPNGGCIMKVFDQMGREVHRREIEDNSGFSVNLDFLDPDIYFIHLIWTDWSSVETSFFPIKIARQ